MSTLKAKTIQPVSDSDTLVLRTGAADSLTLDTNGNATIRGELTVDGINIGQGAGNYDTNTRVGYLSLNNSITPTTTPWNTAVGRSALTALTTSYYNTAVGGNALGNTNTGIENTAIGYNAGASNTDGNNHVAVGSQAGPNSGSLINTTCVGRNAVASASNSVALGYNASASTPNSIYLGNSAVDKLYMGNGAAVAPAYVARAWVTFNTVKNTSGAVDNTATNRLIFGSGNVASVQRMVSGVNPAPNQRFRITFTIPMPNANYAVLGTGTKYTYSNGVASIVALHTDSDNLYDGPSNKTTTSVDVCLVNGQAATTNNYDNQYVSILVFG